MICRYYILFLCVLLIPSIGIGQGNVDEFLAPADSLNVPHQTSVIIAGSAVGVGALVGLNQMWYNDYERSDFHFVNDNSHWLQMDKAGHVFSAYHLSRFGNDALRWSGTSEKKSMIYGAAAGFVFLSAVEVLDGYSANWGASAGDVAANAGGSLLFVSQELLWNEQRITPKYSFHATPYASARPQVLGSTYSEQMLKDYNGQTYWLSANLHSFWKGSYIPKWLNVAVGYGGEGMITGEDDLVNTVFLPEDHRVRQFYFSLDADLTKIETNSHLLKTIFSVINVIKIPAPTFEVNSDGKVKFHPLYF
jgi:uncharacterized protein YfiM (DUF2279 family)